MTWDCCMQRSTQYIRECWEVGGVSCSNERCLDHRNKPPPYVNKGSQGSLSKLQLHSGRRWACVGTKRLPWMLWRLPPQLLLSTTKGWWYYLRKQRCRIAWQLIKLPVCNYWAYPGNIVIHSIRHHNKQAVTKLMGLSIATSYSEFTIPWDHSKHLYYYT